MLIAEIFHSLQGEGKLAGVPSVFIRSSGCNLRCSWCDTPYASWRPQGRRMEVGEIMDAVAAFPARHCVLTGGEPMVARGVRELARALSDSGRHVTIETAATIAPAGVACDLASLSPKLANSTPRDVAVGAGWRRRHEARRRQPEVLRAWLEQYQCQLKFVVASDRDLDEILGLVAACGGAVEPADILLMPEGVDARDLDARAAMVAAACLRHGFRYCDRLHIRLFGNTRGT